MTIEALLNGVFAALGLGLAALVLAPRPRRLVNVVLAALFATNSVYVGFLALATPFGDVSPKFGLVAAVFDFASIGCFLLLPWAWKRPRGIPVPVLVAVGAYVAAGAVYLLGPWERDPVVIGVGQSLVYLPALTFGAWVFLGDYLGGKTKVQTEQARWFLAAYVATEAAWLFPGDSDTMPPEAKVVLQAVAGLGVFTVALALVSSRLRGRAAERPLAADALVLAMLPLGVLLRAGDLVSVNVLLVRPVLFAYAIMRFRLLGVETRERVTVGVVVASALVAVFLSAVVVLESMGASPALAAALPILLVLATAALFAWPTVERAMASSAAGARNREVYMAALEEAVRDGTTQDSRVLGALRERLGFSDREAQLMEADVRAALGVRDPALASGALFLGRYRVEAALGEGGFAQAFLATDEAVGRRVVLKRSREATPEEAERMIREVRLLARLAHPSIVQVHDVERVGNDVIAVLEYVEGGSLAERLQRGPLTLAEAAAVADDVLAALEAAHAAGAVHRDVKPANILLMTKGEPPGGSPSLGPSGASLPPPVVIGAKLADFGIARDATNSGTAAGFSLAGRQPGSLHYMSPEQVRGRPVDGRSDLYSFAATLVEAMTGRPYLNFKGRTDFDARLAILEDRPHLPDGLPSALTGALAEALAKDPAARPASAAVLRRRLAAAVAAVN